MIGRSRAYAPSVRRGSLVSCLCAGLIVLALLVSGCGTAGPGAPSALDPARVAPADSLIYMSLAVRPQGVQRTQVQAALHELLGASADRSVRASVEQLLRRLGVTYDGSVAPWLGQRLAFVATQLPTTAAPGSVSASFALIAPTRNPAAARAFVARLMARDPGSEGHVAGGYAVWGGALAYQAIVATNPANSLASSPGYEATTSQLGGGTTALLYMNLHRFAQQAAARASATGTALTPLLGGSLRRLGAHAALAAGLTLSPGQIRLDTVRSEVRTPAHGPAADVGNLPASSWLALASDSAISPNKLRAGFELGLASALRQGGASASALAGAVGTRLGFLERDVLPALGPMSLAVGGSSLLGLTAGLKLTPADSAAATRVLRGLRALVGRSPALRVRGSATRFTVTLPTGGRLLVDQSRRRVVATYGFASQASFLAPASKLSGNPTYRQAVAQLPSGSHVSLYVSFGPIASLLAELDRKPSADRAVRALQRISYLIVGSSAGRERIVLGLR